MCVRTSTYLVCTNCNNQFISAEYGGRFADAKEAREVARSEGWARRKVPNGSYWDFCPRCDKAVNHG